ncbi:TraB/GumN family protein [Massilia sp. DWR3-1-1]|uniref:TraB/GumN family protein n=1 Tax=Massilia sp. DWR3-1-1 TaxID=2804559 RepID=UPI003CF23A77
MKRRHAILLCCSILSTPVFAQEAVNAAPEQVLVVGQRPGPGLWKVSKDDHVLWVFGTYAPLPAQLQWRSQEVETIIAQSQELLGVPGMGLHVGWMDSLNILTALPSLIGARKNVNGESLQEVVPADVYVRWTALKGKYIGADQGVESLRPMFAAEQLFTTATSKSGLATGTQVEKRIYAIAKEHKLKLTTTSFSIPLENPRGALKDFKKSTLDDLACFTKTIDRLETDLEGMRVRANAWAIGDVDKMRALSYPDHAEACREAVTNSAWMKGLKGAENLDARVKATWLAAAEKALSNNRSTFALLPVSQAMNAGGFLDSLKEKGYAVEQP